MKARKREDQGLSAGGKTREKARVLVVDDHPIVCQGLAGLINRQADVVCCGAAGSLKEAQQAIVAQKPDLLLLDLRLDGSDGLEAIKTLRSGFPGLPILIISQFDENLYSERVLRAGAMGYVMKEQVTDEVLQAIRTVLAGQIYISPRMSMRAVRHMIESKPAAQGAGIGALSDRELHVFKAIGAGKANKQIAAELCLSVKTIETYREHIKYKLGLANSPELVLRAKQSAEGDGRTSL